LPLPANAAPDSRRAIIRKLRAHVYFPPEQIYVSQADGMFCGIHVSASGQLIKRSNAPPSQPISPQEWQQRLTLLQRVVDELGKFRFESAPELQLKFSGDVAQLEDARVDATLRGDRIRRDGYECRGLRIAGEFAEQELRITECEWQDYFGGLNANALWRRADGALEFQARSSINLRALLDGFGIAGPFSDITFFSPPRLEVSGTGKISAGGLTWQTIGRAAVDRFSYKLIPFNGASAEFSWDGTRTMLRDVHVRHQSGELVAQLLDAPGDFRLDFTSTIDANALRSLAPPGVRDFAREWDWPHASNVRLAIRGRSRDPATWKGDGQVQLERGRFRGVAFNKASAAVHFSDGAVTYENFHVTRDEGSATGTFTYDFAHHETRVSTIHSTLRPAETIPWVDPDLLKIIKPYKFSAPPVITADGVYQFRGGKSTHLEISVSSPGRMEYVLLGKTLPIDNVAATLIVTKDRLQIAQLNGSIFSGAISGNADISLARNDKHYRASITADGVDFPRLTNLYFGYETAHGSMSGHYDWSGNGDDARTMTGQGEVDVRNGDVFAVPLFGPLSNMLDAIIPGVGYRVARKASMSFTIHDGVIRTPDFHVDAGTFGMIGHGDSHFLDDKIDFDVRVQATGAGAVLTPLYKFFEYRAEGSLSHPTWRAKNL